MVHSFEPLVSSLHRLQTSLLVRVDKTTKRKRTNSDPSGSESDTVSGANSSDSQDASSGEEDIENGEETTIAPRGFPHAPLIKVPNFPEQSQAGAQYRNLKVQHLNVLCALINKCLQSEDFVRAQRAFSLLLRFDIHDRLVDLRKRALWGLGAELLFQQSIERSRPQIDGESYAGQVFPLSKKALRNVRDYYERLILQYPYQKFRPKAINSQDFYPAMFGLWIMHAHLRTRAIKNNLDADAQVEYTSENTISGSDSVSENGNHSENDETSDSNIGEVTLLNARSKKYVVRRAKQTELSQARKIAERMDEVMFLPPYDQDVKLLRLRGNVYIWIADLALNVGGSEDEVRQLQKKATEQFNKVRIFGEALGDEDDDYEDKIQDGLPINSRHAGATSATSLDLTNDF